MSRTFGTPTDISPRRCTQCGGLGPFTTNKDAPDGLRSRCVSCVNKKWKEQYQTIRDDYLKQRRERYPLFKDKIAQQAARKLAVPRNRILSLVRNAKNRALKMGLDFDPGIIVLADNPPTKCKCCGCLLDYSTQRGKCYGKGMRSRSPSLDRVENNRGYVFGNVEIICMYCNTFKNDATFAELEIVLAYMEARLSS